MIRPMLAAVYPSLSVLENRDKNKGNCNQDRFPLLATPKIDGIRALIVDGQLVSRSLKPIRNKNIRTLFEPILPEGADGEIVCGDFYETSSVVMSYNKELPKNVLFYWFDIIPNNDTPYEIRVLYIQNYVAIHELRKLNVVPLVPRKINNTNELMLYEEEVLSNGFEGLMLRLPESPYKFGRSTLKEGYLMKLKRFIDSEAVVVDTEELMHNMNDEQKDCLGYTKRSSTRDGLVEGNTLGAIVAVTSEGVKFKIGSGYTLEQRHKLWHDRKNLVGRLVKYKHINSNLEGSDKKYGKMISPRSAVFLGLRHSDDT